MSRVLFHSRDEDTVEVLGSERAHMGTVIKNIACAMIPTFHDTVREHLTPAMWSLSDGPGFHRMLSVQLAHGTEDVFHVDGKPLDNFSLLLNTAVAVGSDPVCLMARLHAQCEIHGYVEGPDRAWMADVIEQGLATGLYRSGAGWDGVVTLLRSRDDAPVVTSFTVTESFPNAYVCGWSPPADAEGPNWDLWYDVPTEDQWDMSIAALRADDHLTSISPETLREHLYGHGRTIIDVFAQPQPAQEAAS